MAYSRNDRAKAVRVNHGVEKTAIGVPFFELPPRPNASRLTESVKLPADSTFKRTTCDFSLHSSESIILFEL